MRLIICGSCYYWNIFNNTQENEEIIPNTQDITIRLTPSQALSESHLHTILSKYGLHSNTMTRLTTFSEMKKYAEDKTHKSLVFFYSSETQTGQYL